jgi:phospholipase D1/2
MALIIVVGLRWDTPQHVIIDDTADTDRAKIWPGMYFDVTPLCDTESLWGPIKGKDYSNPRISDFFNLHKPEEDMYDRTKVPRMPWYILFLPLTLGLLNYQYRSLQCRHDVSMQIIGQPARDLARHFVQR